MICRNGNNEICDNVSFVIAEVSVNAKPFFINRGFEVIKEQVVHRNGVDLINFLMEKKIGKKL